MLWDLPQDDFSVSHELRTPSEAFFHQNHKLLGLGKQFGLIIFGDLSAPLSMFSINQPLFLQRTKPIYPNPKYLFGI